MRSNSVMHLLYCLISTGVLLLAAGCDYARMTSDDGQDTYEAGFPLMPSGSIAVNGGMAAMRMVGRPDVLENPLKPTPVVLSDGRRSYGNFCVHCHGPRGDGKATVGQSFAPLPTDLQSEPVQRQSDAELFFKIGFGFKRHPNLSHTMVENDIWAVIIFIRHMNRNG